jgi:hypothetical protein
MSCLVFERSDMATVVTCQREEIEVGFVSVQNRLIDS